MVYESIQKVPRNSKSRIKSFLKFILHSLGLNLPFELNENFSYIMKRYGIPKKYPYSWKMRLQTINQFDKFVIVWTVSNYYAIKNIEKEGLMIVYDEIFLDHDRFIQKLNEYLSSEGIKINTKIEIHKKNLVGSDKLKKVFLDRIKYYELEEHLDYILKEVEKNGVMWQITDSLENK